MQFGRRSHERHAERLFVTLGLALSLGAGGCAVHTTHANAPKVVLNAKGPVTLVDDAGFANATYRVLVTGSGTPERSALLAGVVNRQLKRAQARFDAGQPSAGLAALRGAFFLMRVGEFREGALDGADAALSDGADEVARQGKEGDALALYNMLRETLPAGPQRAEVEAHLQALARFSQATQSSGPMQTAASDMNVAVQRSLLDPRQSALDSASDRIVTWIKRAIELNGKEASIHSSADQNEAFEAYRALRGGGYSLVALYLRQGDPRTALTVADRAGLGRVIVPELRDRLERAADNSDADAWEDLYQFFDSASHAQDTEGIVDHDLMEAAAWGSALELFRAGPNSMHVAVPLAMQLASRGMAEVAPLVLAPAVAKEGSPENLSFALGLIGKALVADDALDQLSSARRTFENAQPMLAQAENKINLGRVNPSSAKLRYVMGVLETRHGELSRALPLVQAAATAEPTVEALMTLSAIQRQQDKAAALVTLRKAVTQAKAQADVFAEADALSTEFEVYRDQGDAVNAARTLDEALARAVDAQKAARQGGVMQARAERLLARVLEHYNDALATRRATERAYEASRSDLAQLTATVLDSARRALTYGDLSAARRAAQRAVDAGMSGDDLVYVALWLQLVEKKLNAPSDGTLEAAYAGVDEDSGWPAKLRAWARGKLTDQELATAAHSTGERTEAMFYAAMSKLEAGGDSWSELARVAQSQAIDLVEVTIARDLLALHAKPAPDYKLPPSVVLP